MAATSGAIDRLIGALGRLPGVGAKTAERLAHYLLKCPSEEALALAGAFQSHFDLGPNAFVRRQREIALQQRAADQ